MSTEKKKKTKRKTSLAKSEDPEGQGYLKELGFKLMNDRVGQSFVYFSPKPLSKAANSNKKK